MSNKEFIGGTLNFIGAAPGEHAWPDPVFSHVTNYSLKFTSTYEAIEKYILPPPLKVDRSFPPEVTLLAFSSPFAQTAGGAPTPYFGVQFRGHTEFEGKKGMAGWEYVDGVTGDKSECDAMGPWGVYFGMAKKFANIHFIPVSGDALEIKVVRQGVQIIKIHIRVGAEVEQALIKSVESDPKSSNANDLFTVREIPNANYSAFTERSVLCCPASGVEIKRIWAADQGTIEFTSAGYLDPMGEVPVLGITEANVFIAVGRRELFSEMYVVGTL